MLVTQTYLIFDLHQIWKHKQPIESILNANSLWPVNSVQLQNVLIVPTLSHQWINKDCLQTGNVKVDVRVIIFSLLCVKYILALSKHWIRREYNYYIR